MYNDALYHDLYVLCDVLHHDVLYRDVLYHNVLYYGVLYRDVLRCISTSLVMQLRRQCVPSWCLRVTFIDDVLCRVRHLIQSVVHLRLILENERSDELVVDEDGTVPRRRHHAVDEEHALKQ